MPQALSIETAMANAAQRAQAIAPPERYRWHAVWWHLQVKRSKAFAAFEYSKNMLELRRDMISRPEHFKKKPATRTDWEWSLIK